MASKSHEDSVFSAQGKPISMREWRSRVRSFLKFGQPTQKMLVCEGEAGCGKSDITTQVCKEMGLDPIICPGLGAQQQEEWLAMVKLDTDEEGNGKIVQGVLENLIPTEKLLHDEKYIVETTDNFGNEEKKIVIPWIIDECFTGNAAQLNQLRAALSFRRIGSTVIPQEVYMIGTSNPEDVVYSSRRSVDAAVMDRIARYNVYMDFEDHQLYLANLAKQGRYPEVCRLFLRMEDNKDLWRQASPRFWHQQFGLTWDELSRDPDMDDSARMKLFAAELADHFKKLAEIAKQRRAKDTTTLAPDALVARFHNFIEHGDDPHWYPISANRILSEDTLTEKDKKRHLALFQHWNNENMHGFIAVTVQDLTNVISNLPEDQAIEEDQAEHIAKLLELSGVALATQLLKAVFKAHKRNDTYAMLTGAIKETKVYEGVAQAFTAHDKMVKGLAQAGKSKKVAKRKD